MGPRILFKFEHIAGIAPMTMPVQYRVVDRSASSVKQFPSPTNCCVERLDGWDAMEQPRWIDAGQDGVEALLNELIYFTVTRNEPQESVA